MNSKSHLKHYHSKPILEELESRQLFSAGVEGLLTEPVLDPSAVYANANPAPAAETQQAPALNAGSEQTRNEIVFVDTSVQNYQSLLNDIKSSDVSDRNLEIITLDSSTDGIQQITQALAQRDNLDAVHIISHGSDGSLDLGNSQLNFDTLIQNQTDISAWGNAFNQNGDILLYGCNVAETQFGQSFVEYLSGITDTDVAASQDETGSLELGGDWQLEYQTGDVETQVAVSAAAQSEWTGLMAVTQNAVSSTSSTSTTQLSWQHIVNNGTNRALFVQVSIDNVNASVTGVTYGGVALTQVGRSTGNHAVEIWALVNPTAGTANVVVSFSASTAASAGATTFNGVNQASAYSGYTANSGTGSAGSVTVTSAIGDMVLDAQYWQGVPSGGSPGGGQTIQWWQQNAVMTSGSTKETATSTSVLMSSSFTSSTYWQIAGVSVKASTDVAPVNTVPGAQTTNEDTAKVFSVANGNAIAISDADAGPTSNEVTLSVTNGTLTLAGTTGLSFVVGNGSTNTTMTFRGTAGDINTALNGLSYTPTANYSGSATLTLSTKDSVLLSLNIDNTLVGRYSFENTGALGADTSPAAAYNGTVVNGTTVNDATRGNVLSLAGDGYIQTTGHFGNPANVTLAAWVNLTTADTGGAEVISLGDYVVLRLDQSGKIKGTYNDGSTYRFTEYATTLAGTGWHHVAYTMDDANNSQILYLDGVAIASTTATTSIAWAATGNADSFIGKHPSSASYHFNGKIDDARIYNRALTAAEIATLSKDLTLTDTDSVAVTVSAVNDAPVNTIPSAQTTNEDTTKVFSSANGNAITIVDADAGGANNEITLTATNGTLTLAGTTGLTFVAGDGTADSTITVRGTASAINTALDGLSYTPTANYNGSATLTVSTKDSVLLSLDIDTSLKGHYTFDSTGALGTDTSPAAGYNGTVVNGTSVNDATRGNVLSLAGNGYIQTTGHYGDPANVTLAAWVNLTTADSSGSVVISLGDSVGISLDNAGRLDGFYYNGINWPQTFYTTTLAGAGWHHVAYTFNDAGNMATLYLDGVAVGSLATTDSISYTLGADSFIGKHGNGSTTYDFTGKIDDARVYSRVLTADEIATLASDLAKTDTDSVAVTVSAVNDAPNDLFAINGIAESSLVGVYGFTNSTNLGRDDAGNNAPITFYGNPGQTTGPSGSGALDLAGGTSDQYGDIVGITTGGAMTFAASVKFDSTADWQRVFDFGQTTSGGIGNVYVGRDWTTNNLTFTIEKNGVYSYRATATNAITNGSWLHFAATVDATGSMNLYVNGNLAASTTGVALETGVRSNNFVGKSHWAGDAAFDGAIDNFVVANGAMSASQVAALYQQTSGFTVAENAANGTVIGTVVGYDVDASANPTYSLTDSAGGRFAINSTNGTLTVADGSLLNYEAATSHSITVQVTDSLGASYSETYTVSVSNVVEAPSATNLSASESYTEDTALNLTDIVITRGDNATVTATLTLSNAAAGSLNTATSGPVTSTYNATTGVWTASGAVADVNTLLTGLTFTPASNFNSNFTIATSVSDGVLAAVTGTKAMTGIAVNDAPVLTFISGNANYPENYGAVIVSSSATITDVDSSNFDTGQMRVYFSANGQAEDRIGIQNQGSGAGQIGVSGANVSYGGVVIGTYTGGTDGSTPLVVTFNANATVAAVQALGRSITYQNVSDNPSTAVRTMAGYVTDGDGGTSNIVSGTLTIIPANDAQVISAVEATTLAYTENGAATAISATLALSDADNANLTGATVQITGNYASGQDVLAFSDQNGITGSWDSITGTLTLSGSASVAQYQSALRSVTYQNTSDAPSTASRTVSFSVTDGTTSSNTATRSLSVAAVNDAPTATITPASYSATEQTSLTLHGTGLSIADVDAASASVQTTVSVVSGTLTASAGTTGVTVSGSGTSSITLTGSLSQINDLLAGNASGSLSYIINSDTPPASDTLTLSVNDQGNTGSGGSLTGFDVATIDITAVNDAPVNTIAGDGTSVLEDSVIQLLGSVVIADADSGSGTMTTTLTVSAGAGVLSATSAAGVTISGSGTNTLVLSGDLASINAYFASAATAPVFTATADYNGAVSFTVVTTDNGNSGSGGALSDSNTISGSISAVADVVNDSITTNEDTPVTFDPLANDTFENAGRYISAIDGTSVSSGETVAITGGNVTLNADGTLTFTPTANSNGATSLSYTVTSGVTTETATVALTVNPVNDAPVLTSASLTLSEGQTVTLSAANFGVTDPDNSSFTYTLSSISGGYFQLTTNPGVAVTSFTTAQLGAGQVQFIDDGNEVAPSFSVTVSDGVVDSNTLAATVNYTAVNDAPTDIVATRFLSDQSYQSQSMYDLTINTGHSGYGIVLDGVSYARGLGTHPGPAGDGYGYVDYAVNGATSFKATIGINDYQTGVYGSVRFYVYVDGVQAYSSGVLDSASTPIDLNISVAGASTIRLAVDNANNGNAFDHGVWANARLEGGTVALSSIAENAANGTVVGTVVGLDNDPHENWSYALTDNAGGRFAINTATGQITVADGSLLNFEAAASHNITVRATDTGGLSVDKTFTLSLTDVNEAPVINSASLSLNEGDTVTLSTANFSVSDPDNASFTYTVSSVSGGYFQLTTNPAVSVNSFTTAQLSAGQVQFVDDGNEVAPNFSVTVNDGALNSNTMAATINYTAVNDNAPVISSGSTASVNENSAVGTVVYTASGSDADGNPLTWSLSGTDAALLNIDTSTGAVTLNAPADYETKASYSFNVVASDGTLSSSQAVTLTVNNLNDNAPVISSGSTASVNEISAVGTVVYTASGSDADGNSLTWSLSGDDAALLSIDTNTGAVTLNAPADYETKASYSFNVVASDGAFSNSHAVTLTVNNLNDNAVVGPTDANSSVNTVAENAANGTVVGLTALATDADAGATISYSLSDTAGGRFAIDSTTGVVTVADGSLLDYETATSHSITVLATSSDGSTNSQSFSIAVTNVNDNPVSSVSDTNNSVNTVAENAANGTVVGVTTFATDADAGATISYSLSDDAGGRFAIDSSTGVVTVADGSLLDYETATSHSITVLATSSDGSTNSQSFTIAVSNLNDNPVSSVSDSDTSLNTISENAATGTVVGLTALASDADAGATISYSLSDTAGGRFAIDSSTGVVTVANGSLLDYETATSHSITVLATSSDGSTNSQTFSIAVTNVNDNPVSALTDSNATANSVAENAATGTVVGITALATDADNGATISYSLSDDAGGRFAIDSSTGVVTVADGSLLNYETATSHSITVLATSSDGSTNSQTFSIAVTNVNDNAPVLSSADMTLSEGQTVTLSSSNFGVNDPDNSSFTYVVSNVSGGYFQLTANPGVSVSSFTTAQLIAGQVQFVDDGNEVAPSFSVTVNDGALSSNTLVATINYTTANDAPMLTNANLTINEGGTVTLSVANFGVSDPDNASFTFVVSSVRGGYFRLATNPGVAVTRFTTAQLAANRVQFVDDGNEVAPSFSVTVNDGTVNSNTLAATINYTLINDAPVLGGRLRGSVLTLTEGQTVTLSATNFGVSDPDSTSFIYNVSDVYGGFFQLSSNPGLSITNFTTADLRGGLVQFVDDGNEVTPSFNVSVNDGLLDSNRLAETIDYSPVNDAPVINSASLTVNEGQTVTLSAANFGVSDPDSSSFTYTLSQVSGGYFQLSTHPGISVTSFNSTQLATGQVQFVDDGNKVAPSFSVAVNDGMLVSDSLTSDILYSATNNESNNLNDIITHNQKNGLTDKNQTGTTKSNTIERPEVQIDSFHGIADLNAYLKNRDGDATKDRQASGDTAILAASAWTDDQARAKPSMLLDDNKHEALRREKFRPYHFQAQYSAADHYAIDSNNNLTEHEEVEFWNRLDLIRKQMSDPDAVAEANPVNIKIILGTSAGLTAGFVSWILRAGSLMASFMSTVPLLKRYDPLPIMRSAKKSSIAENTESGDTDSETPDSENSN